jgi:glycosyltransferase involved in cell wall biosynthesis
VVSDRVGCREDLVLDGETGYGFPANDASALAQRLDQLADDPQKASQMGQAARQRIERFSPQSAAEGIKRAVKAIVVK